MTYNIVLETEENIPDMVWLPLKVSSLQLLANLKLNLELGANYYFKQFGVSISQGLWDKVPH